MPHRPPGAPQHVRAALHRAAAVALLRLSPLSPLPPHMADLTDLSYWRPYPDAGPPTGGGAQTPAVRARRATIGGRSDRPVRSGLSVRAHVRKSARTRHAARTHAEVGSSCVTSRSGSPAGGAARPPRCARGVRCARARGAAPRAARGGGGPLAPLGARAREARKCGRPCCCCGCGFALARSPDAGVTREVRAAPAMHARRCLGTEARPRGHPPATQQPQGGLGPKSSQYRPICTRSLPRHPRAPPARAARPRRPLAPPVRAAHSRSPLAPSARAATSPHRHRARHRTLMVSLDFPIPSHLHTPLFMPPACAAARSARPREASEHERGAGHRASRGDFAQALRSAHTAPFR